MADNGKLTGLSLAVGSSFFNGSAFVITKQGLENPDYLHSKIYWLGILTMAVGAVINTVAYSFTSAISVTLLGALSVGFGNILAFVFLKEKMSKFGLGGIILCLLGAVLVIFNAPEERTIDSVDQIVDYATKPGFLVYVFSVLSLTYYLVFKMEHEGKKSLYIYLGICSAIGSLTVIASKAFGIAIKLTIEGKNQLVFPSTWFFLLVMSACIRIQMLYLNRALDAFASNVVTPLYYCGFTSLTILANVVLLQGIYNANIQSILGLVVGFLLSVVGAFIIHDQHEFEDPLEEAESEALLQTTNEDKPTK